MANEKEFGIIDIFRIINVTMVVVVVVVVVVPKQFIKKKKRKKERKKERKQTKLEQNTSLASLQNFRNTREGKLTSMRFM